MTGQLGGVASDGATMVPVAPPVEGRRWLTPDPISPDSVHGRVVVLTFWSLGCEASIRAVEQLQAIGDLWPDQVAVVAVHSPRFPYEDDERRLRQALARHRLRLPVVHDPEYLTWNRYNPVGWPATAVVDRAGKVVGMTAGLDGFETVTDAVAAELSQPQGRRDRDRRGRDASERRRRRSPVVASFPERGPEWARIRRTWIDDIDENRFDNSLWFPSAVAVGPSGTMAVADSGNDRLLVGPIDADLRTFRPEIEVTDVANPTAVVVASDSLLYVIERATGSVLQIDLEAGAVDVVADDELSIPTGLVVDRDGSLVVADAGLDQLVRIAPDQGRDAGPDADVDRERGVVIGAIAGSGGTGCQDGPGPRADLAQPVAVARTDAGIAFCDAASSTIRLLTDRGEVLTVTGSGYFDWGLVDGPAPEARLQRPGGLAAAPDDSLLIADTGNDRIRVLADRRIRTLGLTGLDQPTGLAVLASGHVVVADTGNHRLVVADPDGRRAWPLAVYPAAMTSVWHEAPVDASRSASIGRTY